MLVPQLLAFNSFHFPSVPPCHTYMGSFVCLLICFYRVGTHQKLNKQQWLWLLLLIMIICVFQCGTQLIPTPPNPLKGNSKLSAHSFYIITFFTFQRGSHIDTIAAIQSIDSTQTSAAVPVPFSFLSHDPLHGYTFLSLSSSHSFLASHVLTCLQDYISQGGPQPTPSNKFSHDQIRPRILGRDTTEMMLCSWCITSRAAWFCLLPPWVMLSFTRSCGCLLGFSAVK